MDEPQAVEEKAGHPTPHDAGVVVREFLHREVPFFILLGLTILGVAFTSFSRRPVVIYWELLAPLIGGACILTGWPHAHDKKARIRLIWTQALHWAAFLIAMNLVLLTSVSRVLNAQSTGLTVLMLLALGTFIAGVHSVSWQICFLGITMAIGVPAIAWIYNASLILLFGAIAATAIIMTFWRRRSETSSRPKM